MLGPPILELGGHRSCESYCWTGGMLPQARREPMQQNHLVGPKADGPKKIHGKGNQRAMMTSQSFSRHSNPYQKVPGGRQHLLGWEDAVLLWTFIANIQR